MNLESLNLRHASVTDLTQRAGDSYSRVKDDAKRLGLDDNQTVEETANSNGTEKSKFNLDGTLKEEHGGEPEQTKQADTVFPSEAKFDKDKDGKADKAEQHGDLSIDKKLSDPLNKTNKSGDTNGVRADENSDNSKTANHGAHKHDGFDKDCPLCQCETCRNRRYQDGSDDSAVSFQNPTKLSPEAAAYRVRGHEMEHVRNEQYEAMEDGKKIVSQSVRIKTDICPECGKTYVSGGETRTEVKEIGPEFNELFRVGADDLLKKGDGLDVGA